MKVEQLNRIMDAVLNEGQAAVSSRPFSSKNPGPASMGCLYPEAYHAARRGAELWTMQTQCLLRQTSDSALFDVSVRFLQPVMMEVARPLSPMEDWSAEGRPKLALAPQVQVDDQTYTSSQECTPRDVQIPNLTTEDHTQCVVFSFPALRTLELVRDKHNRVAAVIIQRRATLEGVIEVSTTRQESGLRQVTVRVVNRTPIHEPALHDEKEVLMRTFAFAHTLLQTHGGEFLSATHPPAYADEAMTSCHNIGCWPVLVGDERSGQCDTLLSSSLILPDYPKLVPTGTSTALRRA